MKQKKTSVSAKKQVKPRPNVAGKAPRKTFPTHPSSKSKKVPKEDKDAFPFTREEVLNARRLSEPTAAEMKDLKNTKWKDETYELDAECVEEPMDLPEDYRILRTINEFSFWHERKTTAKQSKKALRPTAPVPGAGELWSDFVLRGRVASLNGPARYLAMAGEFYVRWPTMGSYPLELSKGEIENICLIRDRAFRDEQPALVVFTKKCIYILLTPDFFFEDQWKSVIPFWEIYTENDNLYIDDINHTHPRPKWWHGRRSFAAYRRWKARNLDEDAEPVGTIDTSRDGPQPGDLKDDQYGLEYFSDYSGSELSSSESDDSGEDEEEATVGTKGKGAVGTEAGKEGKAGSKGNVGGSKQQQAKEQHKTGAKEHKDRDKVGVKDQGKRPGVGIPKITAVPAGSGSGASSSKLVGGTGPPKKLGSSQAPVAKGKRKAAEEHAKPANAVRPRRDAGPEQKEMESGSPGEAEPSSLGTEPADSGPQATAAQLPLDVVSPPASHPFGPQQANPPDSPTQGPPLPITPLPAPTSSDTGPPSNRPQIEGVSRGLDSLQLSSNLSIFHAQNLAWEHGWSLPQPYVGGSAPPPFPNIEYDPADMSGVSGTDSHPFISTGFSGTDHGQQFDPEVQYQQLQMVQSILQQNEGENSRPFEVGAPHDQYFPA